MTNHSLTVGFPNSGYFKNEKKNGKGLFRDVYGNYFAEEWDMNNLISKKELKGALQLEASLV